jgi:hypothetical protein
MWIEIYIPVVEFSEAVAWYNEGIGYLDKAVSFWMF